MNRNSRFLNLRNRLTSSHYSAFEAFSTEPVTVCADESLSHFIIHFVIFISFRTVGKVVIGSHFRNSSVPRPQDVSLPVPRRHEGRPDDAGTYRHVITYLYIVLMLDFRIFRESSFSLQNLYLVGPESGCRDCAGRRGPGQCSFDDAVLVLDLLDSPD